MADHINVSAEWLNKCMNELAQVKSVLENANSSLGNVDLSRRAGGDKALHFRTRKLTCGAKVSGSNVSEYVSSMSSGINTFGTDLSALISSISRNIALFNDAEKNNLNLITGNSSGSGESSTYKDSAGESRSDSGTAPYGKTIYTEENAQRNKYGGNQSGPYYDEAHYDTFREIIYRNTGVRYTDEQLRDYYLHRLNAEGCTYTAMINIIMAQYEGRPDDFRRDFGFDMYNERGELNYNTLLVDLYSSVDNHNPNWLGQDKYNRREDYSIFTDPEKNYFTYDEKTDTSGIGNTTERYKYRLEKYLNDRGVNANVRCYDSSEITPENFEEKAKGGQIQISLRPPYQVQDALSGETATYQAGHTMVITGVEDGKYVCTSYGRKFYVDISAAEGEITYEQVVFE